MAQCPKCKQELDHLLSQQYDTVTYQFDGENYTKVGREVDIVFEPVHLCPWCREVLAVGESEGKKVLGR